MAMMSGDGPGSEANLWPKLEEDNDSLQPGAMEAMMVAFQACDYVSSDLAKAVQMAEAALAITRGCPEAFNVLAQCKATSLDEALVFYTKAEEASRLMLIDHEERVKFRTGKMWDDMHLRPLFRSGVYFCLHGGTKCSRCRQDPMSYTRDPDTFERAVDVLLRYGLYPLLRYRPRDGQAPLATVRKGARGEDEGANRDGGQCRGRWWGRHQQREEEQVVRAVRQGGQQGLRRVQASVVLLARVSVRPLAEVPQGRQHQGPPHPRSTVVRKQPIAILVRKSKLFLFASPSSGLLTSSSGLLNNDSSCTPTMEQTMLQKPTSVESCALELWRRRRQGSGPEASTIEGELLVECILERLASTEGLPLNQLFEWLYFDLSPHGCLVFLDGPSSATTTTSTDGQVEKAELFAAIGWQVLERWREASGRFETEETSKRYAQLSAGLWRRLWAATGDGVVATDGEGVAVLLLRCLTVVHGFLTSSRPGRYWEAKTPLATSLLAQFKQSVLQNASAAVVLEGLAFLSIFAEQQLDDGVWACFRFEQLWDRADDPCLLRLFGHEEPQVRLATLKLIRPSNKYFLAAYRHHSYSKIWWMCIDDCDARVRAVACRRLHAAYSHDAAIELCWQLPAIAIRLDKETDPSALMSLLVLLANFVNRVASNGEQQSAEWAALINKAGLVAAFAKLLARWEATVPPLLDLAVDAVHLLIAAESSNVRAIQTLPSELYQQHVESAASTTPHPRELRKGVFNSSVECLQLLAELLKEEMWPLVWGLVSSWLRPERPWQLREGGLLLLGCLKSHCSDLYDTLDEQVTAFHLEFIERCLSDPHSEVRAASCVALKSYHRLLLQRPDLVAKLLSLLAPSSSPTEHMCRAVSDLMLAPGNLACLGPELKVAAIRALVLLIRHPPTRRAFTMALDPVQIWGQAQCTQAHVEPNHPELLDWVVAQLLEVLAAPPDDVITEGEMLVLVKSLHSLVPPSGGDTRSEQALRACVAVVNWLAISNPKSQLVPDLLSLLLELCEQDPTRLLSADDTIESSLRTVISANAEANRPLLKQLVACLPGVVEACLDQILPSHIAALAQYQCTSFSVGPNILQSTPLFADIGLLATRYPTQLRPWLKDLSTTLAQHFGHFVWDFAYGQLQLVGVHYADHLGADLLQLLPHVSVQVNWTPHDDLAACTQGMANMMAALVRRHADVVTSVADRIKMVRALVAWFVEAERAPSGESTPNRELRDKVGAALEALLGEGEGGTDPLELWREVYKYDHRGQWLSEEDARVQGDVAAVIRAAGLLPPEHPFLALQPPAVAPMDQDFGWSA